MLESFAVLVEQEKENLELEDLNLAIYFHIINNKYEIAKNITKYGLENFEDKAIFY
jgi:hypothetical protein